MKIFILREKEKKKAVSEIAKKYAAKHVIRYKGSGFTGSAPPEVYSGGLVDTSDETLETLLRTVVTGHRLI